ncbi:hypothetical protein D3C73_506190 [compost metagenome]
MKKVSAFCHFQQLMGTFELVGPLVNDLWIDHFVGFRLDQGQLALLRQLILVPQAHDRRRDHEQVLELLALGLKASAETCCNKTAERKTEQGQRQLRVFVAKPFGDSLGIINFTGTHVVGALAGTNATIVEAQGDQSGVARSALQGRNHFVEHGATLDRVWMADQRQAARLLVVQVKGFQLTHRAINHYRGFAHKQGRNSVTSNRVDSSSKLSVAVYCE